MQIEGPDTHMPRGKIAMLAAGFCLLGAICAPLTVSPASADEHASSWAFGHKSRARLIAGPVAAGEAKRGGEIIAGVDIRLDPGWKTYWRNPGESGVPPYFDWTGSKNVKRVTVLYPSPHRFVEPYGQSIGYKRGVVFPVRVVPKDAGKPLALKLTLSYGVCKDLCIPAQASLTLAYRDRPKRDGLYSEMVEKSLASVPRPQAGRASLPKFERVVARLEGDAPSLAIDVRFAPRAEGKDVFVEGPEGTYLAMPKRVGKVAGGLDRYIVSLKGVDVGAELKQREIRLTAVSSAGQSEFSWRLQ